MLEASEIRARRPALGAAARLVVALLLALGLGDGAPAAAVQTPDPRIVRLEAGAFDPLRETLPDAGIPFVEGYPPGVRGAYLVQFQRPIRAEDRQALEAAGAAVKGYVPMMTLEVVMAGSARAAVEAIDGVRWVGPLQAAHKIARELLRDGPPSSDAKGRLDLRVSLFPGEEGAAAASLRALGARVERIDRGRSFAVAQVTIPASRLVPLARLPLVRRVERLPQRIPLADRARFYGGLQAIADDTFSTGLDPSLDGRDEPSGFQVKYGHTDGGLWPGHADFQTGVASGWISSEPGADQVDASGHGTHTAGILIGDGASWSSVPEVPPGSGAVAPGRWRGVQPQAALHHISFENEYSDQQILERHAEEGAHILTNSWGYADCPFPPFICSIISDYDTAAAIWDEGVWDAASGEAGLQPLVVFFAAGNDALELLDGCPLFGSGDEISSPGTAKNVITVGANETDRACGTGEGDHAGDVLFASSRGPVDPDATGQGLFKPDLTSVGGPFMLSAEAPGSGGACDGEGFDCPGHCSDSGVSYRYEGGTSMACPLAAGIGGVLIQDLTVNLGVAAPKPSLVKALLVNGARDLQPSGGCSYSFDTTASQIHQGWGRAHAADSLYGPGGTPGARNLALENEVSGRALATGEQVQTSFAVGVAGPLRITLAWTDYPAAPGVGSPLVVNDLDLEVSGPSGRFLGNNFDGDWSETDAVLATPDRYNVVENVYVQDAAPGVYTITVRGFQVSQDQEPEKPGVNQDFSLVWSGPSLLRACADGLDNDGDGATDLADAGCDGPDDAYEHAASLPCDDGIDNDGDGAVDHPADPGCRNAQWSLENPACSDGINNDPGQDALIDYDGGLAAGLPPESLGEPDPECQGDPWRNREGRKRRCGLGFELAALLLLVGRQRGRRRSRR